jgi:hypothetical protein
MRFMRFFLILILRNFFSRVFYAFFTFFSAYFVAFSRVSSSRAAVRLAFFLYFFLLPPVPFLLVQSPVAIFYLPPYVIVKILPLLARPHVLALK